MADGDVRSAIVDYMTAANIAGIEKWYRDEPWIIQGDTWNLDAGYGALAYVHIDDVQDTRLTLPAEDGNKRVEYSVSLLVIYRYVIPTDTQSGDEDAWVDPLDQIVADVKAAIRTDPNAGAPSVIWQWGQSPNGIRHQRDLPVKIRGQLQSWNRIVVDVTEIITA